MSRASPATALRGALEILTPCLAVAALWALTHHFIALSRDGNLYAVQALARLHPALSSDLYLAFDSQDKFTIFSSIYAFFIAHMGLQSAALALFVFSTVLLLAASFVTVMLAFGKLVAWLSICLLVIIAGRYGAYDVFSYTDDYLTARSLAEGMVALALACCFGNHRRSAILIALAAMLVHPLMALPGVLLLSCMRLPLWTGAVGAAFACLSALGVALLAATVPWVSRHLPLMDPAWLEIVQERSQFLFLNFWRPADWEMTARPFVSLTLTTLVMTDARFRKLCLVSMLIGMAGLTIAWLAGTVGPVALLIQGQAWRWAWQTGFIAVLLLAPTVVMVWKDSICGPLCAILLLAGWTWNDSGAYCLALTECSLSLWLFKGFIPERIAGHLRLGFLNSWMAAPMHAIMMRRQSLSIHACTLATALGLALHFVPPSLQPPVSVSVSPYKGVEFEDWRQQIPPSANVLMLPLPTSASFVWVTLHRPSYLSLDQSSGVVFSRQTALEIRRRSEVLLPVAEPNWKVMSRITAKKLHPGQPPAAPKKLSTESLVAICADPQLGFVIAKDDVGFAPAAHRTGAWKDWNLYDCSRVLSAHHAT